MNFFSLLHSFIFTAEHCMTQVLKVFTLLQKVYSFKSALSFHLQADEQKNPTVPFAQVHKIETAGAAQVRTALVFRQKLSALSPVLQFISLLYHNSSVSNYTKISHTPISIHGTGQRHIFKRKQLQKTKRSFKADFRSHWRWPEGVLIFHNQ